MSLCTCCYFRGACVRVRAHDCGCVCVLQWHSRCAFRYCARSVGHCVPPRHVRCDQGVAVCVRVVCGNDLGICYESDRERDVEVPLVPLVVASSGVECWLGFARHKGALTKARTGVGCLTDSTLPVLDQSKWHDQRRGYSSKVCW